MKAFQKNASYNNLSDISDTLREDVQAAISAFMQSLSTSMGIGGYNINHMTDYVPVVLFNLYDGYYIYSPEKVTDSAGNENYEYILKPYSYYTVRYKQSEINDVVINYTLDNYIVVYGWINGTYVVNSGYLVSNDRRNNGEIADTEKLYEIVPWVNISSGNAEIQEASKKEITSNYYIPNQDEYTLVTGNTERIEYLYPRNDTYYVNPQSAQKYYEEAIQFTAWAKENLNWITPIYAMRNNVFLNTKYEEFKDNSTKIFNINTTDNDPEDSTSIFAQHKTNVIKYSIQDNLNQAITAYSRNLASEYEFKLPMLDINEWDLVSTNVCMLAFMQGIPIGTKYYNNYALIPNTSNDLYVSPDSLYFIIDNNNDGEGDDGYYHKIDCPELKGQTNIIGYSNFEFLLKKLSLRDEYSYYMHNEQACYYCIVTSDYNRNEWKNDSTIKKAYYTALAREKYRRYTATDNLEYNIN